MSVSSRFPPEVTAWMERWRLLRDGELLTTHSSWILPVRQGDMPAMLKVARIPDEEAGYRLLTWWDGQGAARVFASAAGALLMERASGAGDLAQIAWSGQDDEACRILCDTAASKPCTRPASWCAWPRDYGRCRTICPSRADAMTPSVLVA